HWWMEPELWLRSHLSSWLRSSLLTTQSMRLEVYELIGYIVLPLLAFGVYRLTIWLLTACATWSLRRPGWVVRAETVVKRLRALGWSAAVLFLRWGLLLLEPDRVVLVPVLAVLNPLVWVLGMWAIFRLIDLGSDVIEAHHAAEGRRPEIT